MSGKPGKQYGLIKSSGRVAGPTKVPAKNPFADDDDDDDDEGDAFASRQSVNAMLQVGAAFMPCPCMYCCGYLWVG